MWTSFGKNNDNIIKMMYSKREVTSLVQCVIHQSLVHLMHENKKFSPLFMERSIYDSINVFSKNLMQEDLISSLEFRLLEYLHETTISTHNLTEPIYIYLNTPIHLCKMHIHFKLDRSEYFITHSLLLQLKELYDQWVEKLLIKKHPILILDGSRPTIELIGIITKFLKSTKVN